MVTLAIMCLIIGLTLPMYRGYTTSWASRNAAQILYSDLMMQRQKAFSLCLPTGLTLGTNGTYTLWEWYNPGAELPEPPQASADIMSSPVANICGFLLALLPVGCNDLITPLQSPRDYRVTKTVSLTRDLAVPISISPENCYVWFVPKRSDANAKWRYCITTYGDITVASGAESTVITITIDGDIVFN